MQIPAAGRCSRAGAECRSAGGEEEEKEEEESQRAAVYSPDREITLRALAGGRQPAHTEGGQESEEEGKVQEIQKERWKGSSLQLEMSDVGSAELHRWIFHPFLHRFLHHSRFPPWRSLGLRPAFDPP